MKNSKDLLGSVVKTAQMGKTGLACVLQAPLRPALRENLERQAAVYQQIEEEEDAVREELSRVIGTYGNAGKN